MKKTALNFCALLLLCSVAFGQTLTQADKEKAATYLDETRDGVGLSEAQMKFKPAPDRWSVAETLELVVLVEDFLLQNVTDKVMKSPPGAADRDTAKIDAMVLAMIPDRSHKAQTPPPVTPTGRWTPGDTLDRFLKTRARTTAFLESTPELRACSRQSARPTIGRIRMGAVYGSAQPASHKTNARSESGSKLPEELTAAATKSPKLAVIRVLELCAGF